MFGASVGFSGSADRMALFPFGPKFSRYVTEKKCARIGHNLKYFLYCLSFRILNLLTFNVVHFSHVCKSKKSSWQWGRYAYYSSGSTYE